uniref:Uncharacterized protein n=2 Tax=Aegilops tauschii subsp. strangulata TaxID=200361 RepID=A0A453Q930_AEGTS
MIITMRCCWCVWADKKDDGGDHQQPLIPLLMINGVDGWMPTAYCLCLANFFVHSEGFIESSSATVGCWLLRKTDKRQDKTREE